MYSVEQNIPLAESCLWQAQRDFFDQEGINAWQGQVPFFITSNPFIAETYAKLILAYCQDLAIAKKLKPTEPIYVFELGTGSGQFSFYCAQALERLLDETKLNIAICYVMTDFTKQNLTFWQQQAVFTPYFHNKKAGVSIDFSLLDLEQPQTMFLERQQLKLHQLANPTILIGNYIFDSVRQNYYAMEHGTLVEKRIETLAPFEQYDQKQKKLLSLKNVKIKTHDIPYTWQEPETPEALYLRFYETHISEGLFSLPVGGFSALDYFQELAPQGFMLISSDKGYNTLSEISMRKKLELVSHGSFSLDVNFHSLSLYFEFLEGRSLLQSFRDGIKTNVFLANDLATPKLNHCFNETCQKISPADYFYYHRNFRNTEFKAETALSQFHLGCYDPYVLSLFIDQICQTLQKGSSPALVQAYCDLIPKFHAHIYPLPKGTDHYFNLGLLLHTLERYASAIPFFEASIQHYGEKFASVYNLGICLSMTEQNEQACSYFEKAVQLDDPGQTRASDWLKKLSVKNTN